MTILPNQTPSFTIEIAEPAPGSEPQQTPMITHPGLMRQMTSRPSSSSPGGTGSLLPGRPSTIDKRLSSISRRTSSRNENLVPSATTQPKAQEVTVVEAVSAEEDFITKNLVNVGNGGPIVRMGSAKGTTLTPDPSILQPVTNNVPVPGKGRRPSLAEIRRQSIDNGGTGAQNTLVPPRPGVRRRSEFKMTIPIFHMREEKRKRNIHIEGIPHDIDRLITNCLKSKNLKPVPGLLPLLKSTLYEDFVKCAVNYSRVYLREKLALTHDRVIKTSGIDAPTSLIHFISELNKTEFQSIDKENLYTLHKNVESTFLDLSKSYFEILVTQRQATSTQSRERILFEYIYTITVDLVCQMLSNYNLSYIIVHELQRSFRTDFFKPPMNDLLRDPQFSISFRFLTSLKSPFLTSSPTSRAQSGKPVPISKSYASFNTSRFSSSFHSTRFSSFHPCSGRSKDSATAEQMHMNLTWNLRKSLVLQTAIAQSNEKGGLGDGKGSNSSLGYKNPDIKKKISLNLVRSLRSPLGEAYLPILI